MRRYSLTALSICPLSTNFRAASMTFSLLKATVDYSLLAKCVTSGTRQYAPRILERVSPRLLYGQAKGRRNPERYPAAAAHTGSPVCACGRTVRQLTLVPLAFVRR